MTVTGRLTFVSWDSTTHTVGSVGGVDAAFKRLTFSMQASADRKQKVNCVCVFVFLEVSVS